MAHPVFSVVTPSYNQARYLPQTIESVIGQEGDFEIEYFIMDGGSTDESPRIICSYADALARGALAVRCRGVRLRWVSEPDGGQSNAINKGLRQSTGDFVSYLNSDDQYVPQAFQAVSKEFQRRPQADFIYGDGDVIGAAGDLQWEWLSRPYNHSVMTSYHFLWNDFTNYIMQQATFWRRSVLDKIGLLDESFHYAMDVEYWVRAGGAKLCLHHLPVKLARFRMIPGTKSLSSPTAFWADQLEIYRRTRGAARLGVFFAYYYYNLGNSLGWQADRLAEERLHVLSRWEALPAAEAQAIRQQADRGYALGCLLLASELAKRPDADRGRVFLSRAITSRPSLLLHPLTFWYLLKYVSGRRGAAVLEGCCQRVAQAYRRRRYDYRYYESRPSR